MSDEPPRSPPSSDGRPVGDPAVWAAGQADRAAVLDVLHHYCHCVDTRDPDGIADQVFAPDGVDDHGFGRWVGREPIREAFTSIVARFAATAHLLSNVRVTVDGDEAHARSHVTAWHWLPGSTSGQVDFVMLGTYEDHLVRLREGWRIGHREFRRLGPTPTTFGDLPGFLRRYRPDEPETAAST